MGGLGSGGHNRKRAIVEACLPIDARMVRACDVLATHTTGKREKAYQWRYTLADGRKLWLMLANTGSGDALAVGLWEGERRGDVCLIAQRVPVSWAACNYGGARLWLHCPLCARRVFRLYYYPHTVNQRGEAVHYFACRRCLGLTYRLRTERGFAYYQTRARKLARRIGREGEFWDSHPIPRERMRAATYARLVAKWREAIDMASEAMARETIAKFGRYIIRPSTLGDPPAKLGALAPKPRAGKRKRLG